MDYVSRFTTKTPLKTGFDRKKYLYLGFSFDNDFNCYYGIHMINQTELKSTILDCFPGLCRSSRRPILFFVQPEIKE